MAIDIRVLTPKNGLMAHLSDLAQLRLRVFRDWPYLYEGSDAEEKDYLSAFAESPGAVCVAAFDNDRMIGASTGLPLNDEHDEFKQPFIDAGHDISKIFYCAESVLLPAYRKQGLYRRFFDGRELHAQSFDAYTEIVFCGVIRDEDHPLRPKDASPLDPVWRHFGYAPYSGLTASYHWRDVGAEEETLKELQFWGKAL